MAHAQTLAKAAKAAKASPRREARARKEERRRSASLKVNAGTARRRGTIAAGKCDKSGNPIGVNSLSAAGATQAFAASELCASMASTIPLQQTVPVYFQCPDGSHTYQPTETWYINMIVPAQKTLMVASLDEAEYALLDSGSGLTSCPISYANNIPLLPRPANLPILSNATGGSVEYWQTQDIDLRTVKPFVVTWHVANVTNLIISTESLTGANIEVRHAKNESSMIMDRCGTQKKSVILHKFAKVPWLKLRLAAVNTKATAIEEIGSDEERQTRLRRKKETLGMDDTLEVPLTRGSEGSDARGSRDPVAHPVETSIAKQAAPDLVLWSDEPGGLLEPAQEERKANGKSVPIGPNPAEKATHELTHTHKLQKLVQLLRAS